MEDSSDRQCPVVYFCGTGKVKNIWYRVNLESDGKDKRKKIYPVGESTSFNLGGKDGSWAVVGDGIYWVAGNSCNLGWQRVLLQHDASDPYDPNCWALESRARVLPRAMPFIAAVGKKLYIIGGTENDHPNVDWSKGFGEIYNIESKTWEILKNPEVNPNCLGSYDTRKAAVVVNDDGETTGIVFYSLLEGSMLFMDLATGESHTSEGHDSFALWNHPLLRHPEGLEDSEDDIDMLCRVTSNIRAVFRNDTFYWFGYDLYLYGYDLNQRKWFRSRSLGDKLGTIKPSMGSTECPNCPVLVGLPNGKFVVIGTEEDPGKLTMASLMVVKEDESLSVSVEYTRAYSFDYHSFVPSDGMAIMKNTGTGEPVQICNGDQIAGA